MLNCLCKIKQNSLVIIENQSFIRGYVTRENIPFYYHSWNRFLSYTNTEQVSSIYLEFFSIAWNKKQLILCFITKELYFWGKLLICYLFYFNMITSFWTVKNDFFGCFWPLPLNTIRREAGTTTCYSNLTFMPWTTFCIVAIIINST